MAARLVVKKPTTAPFGGLAKQYVVKVVLPTLIQDQANSGAISLVCKQEHTLEEFHQMVFAKIGQVLPPDSTLNQSVSSQYCLAPAPRGKRLSQADFFKCLSEQADRQGQPVLYLVKRRETEMVRVRALHMNKTFQVKATPTTTAKQLLQMLRASISSEKLNGVPMELGLRGFELGLSKHTTLPPDAVVLDMWEEDSLKENQRVLFLVQPDLDAGRSRRKSKSYRVSRSGSSERIRKQAERRWSTLGLGAGARKRNASKNSPEGATDSGETTPSAHSTTSPDSPDSQPLTPPLSEPFLVSSHSPSSHLTDFVSPLGLALSGPVIKSATAPDRSSQPSLQTNHSGGGSSPRRRSLFKSRSVPRSSGSVYARHTSRSKSAGASGAGSPTGTLTGPPPSSASAGAGIGGNATGPGEDGSQVAPEATPTPLAGNVLVKAESMRGMSAEKMREVRTHSHSPSNSPKSSQRTLSATPLSEASIPAIGMDSDAHVVSHKSSSAPSTPVLSLHKLPSLPRGRSTTSGTVLGSALFAAVATFPSVLDNQSPTSPTSPPPLPLPPSSVSASALTSTAPVTHPHDTTTTTPTLTTNAAASAPVSTTPMPTNISNTTPPLTSMAPPIPSTIAPFDRSSSDSAALTSPPRPSPTDAFPLIHAARQPSQSSPPPSPPPRPSRKQSADRQAVSVSPSPPAKSPPFLLRQPSPGHGEKEISRRFNIVRSGSDVSVARTPSSQRKLSLFRPRRPLSEPSTPRRHEDNNFVQLRDEVREDVAAAAGSKPARKLFQQAIERLQQPQALPARPLDGRSWRNSDSIVDQQHHAAEAAAALGSAAAAVATSTAAPPGMSSFQQNGSGSSLSSDDVPVSYVESSPSSSPNYTPHRPLAQSSPITPASSSASPPSTSSSSASPPRAAAVLTHKRLQPRRFSLTSIETNTSSSTQQQQQQPQPQEQPQPIGLTDAYARPSAHCALSQSSSECKLQQLEDLSVTAAAAATFRTQSIPTPDTPGSFFSAPATPTKPSKFGFRYLPSPASPPPSSSAQLPVRTVRPVAANPVGLLAGDSREGPLHLRLQSLQELDEPLSESPSPEQLIMEQLVMRRHQHFHRLQQHQEQQQQPQQQQQQQQLQQQQQQLHQLHQQKQPHLLDFFPQQPSSPSFSPTGNVSGQHFWPTPNISASDAASSQPGPASPPRTSSGNSSSGNNGPTVPSRTNSGDSNHSSNNISRINSFSSAKVQSALTEQQQQQPMVWDKLESLQQQEAQQLQQQEAQQLQQQQQETPLPQQERYLKAQDLEELLQISPMKAGRVDEDWDDMPQPVDTENWEKELEQYEEEDLTKERLVKQQEEQEKREREEQEKREQATRIKLREEQEKREREEQREKREREEQSKLRELTLQELYAAELHSPNQFLLARQQGFHSKHRERSREASTSNESVDFPKFPHSFPSRSEALEKGYGLVRSSTSSSVSTYPDPTELFPLPARHEHEIAIGLIDKPLPAQPLPYAQRSRSAGYNNGRDQPMTGWPARQSRALPNISRASQALDPRWEKLATLQLRSPQRCDKCLELVPVGAAIHQADPPFLWHPACFQCRCCRIPITTEYLLHQQQPFCSQACLRESVCDECCGLLKGNFIRVSDLQLHPYCFCCHLCKDKLGAEYEEHDGRPVCIACADEQH